MAKYRYKSEKYHQKLYKGYATEVDKNLEIER